jgi:divinyl protochlorophyllide a 8-vinyl-reductase
MAARVGPNAILQTAEALHAAGGEALAARAFGRAGLASLLAAPPADMVAEDDAARLLRALPEVLPPAQAEALLAEAGRRTGDYILAHRIPRPAQAVLRALPAWAASRLLLAAIRKHAWTFAGSGRVRVRGGGRLEIAANPLAVAGCAWHRAVFSRLFEALVAPRVGVRETACCARGAPACRFEIEIGARAAASESMDGLAVSGR